MAPGSSSWPSSGYTIAEHAADMAAVLRDLGCGPAHLIGSSTGGAIAQVMALDYPDLVRSLTLMGAWAAPDDFFRHQFETRKRILLEAGMPLYVEGSVLFLSSPRPTSATTTTRSGSTATRVRRDDRIAPS